MFTIANSGAYTGEYDETFFTPMNTLFIGIDAAVVIFSAGIMAIVLIRWKKKMHAASAIKVEVENK